MLYEVITVDIRIDPVTEQNMGVRTALVEKGPLDHTIRTYGHITYDETRRITSYNVCYTKLLRTTRAGIMQRPSHTLSRVWKFKRKSGRNNFV